MNIINLLDIFQFLSAIWIIVVNLLDAEYPSLEYQRVLAAFTSLALVIKVLDWFKLFQPTSFFIRLTIDTLYDIRFFSVIFVICLYMFGIPMYMLQLNREEHNALVDETFGPIWPLNALYNQYMLSLGEFSMDNFEENYQTHLIYMIFLTSTFVTQITFLNMLIALMGDTFGRVIEQRDQYAL